MLRVPGGASREVSLTGVPPGEYGVEVTSDTPVVAGAEVRRQAAGRSVADIAWAASADPVTGVAGTALAPPGVSTRLLLTAPRDTVEADVVTGTGASTRVRVPAGTTLGLAQDGVGAVWVRPLPGSGDPQPGGGAPGLRGRPAGPGALDVAAAAGAPDRAASGGRTEPVARAGPLRPRGRPRRETAQ
ncbi:hypothetical protein GCM10025868_36770 [Angustibacter aerolatus]|uniref:Uncharacterized protein n=1 Tax=Angustibacter aerolatus TaxID=1162965 RepID=A0ABQ6JNL7_9ACTN|nr:DUF5719 family protein [Angustibacter aerolatus]GMA88427.1 hypothetical protein GCM10025868_36770 [Angustibacter aerolatus]